MKNNSYFNNLNQSALFTNYFLVSVIHKYRALNSLSTETYETILYKYYVKNSYSLPNRKRIYTVNTK